MIGWPSIKTFQGYEIHGFDPFAFFDRRRHGSLADLVRGGLTAFRAANWLYRAETVDQLYRQRDPAYIRMATQFIERFRDFDLIVLSSFNPIHPELLVNELSKPIRVIGFIDEPVSTYVRGIPYLWAVDGAFYVSPSYDERSLLGDKLTQWGCPRNFWWPLRPFDYQRPEPSPEFFCQRDVDLVYVGLPYGPKIDRLAKLKRHFGKRMRIHGHWPMGGWTGVLRGAFGKPVLWQRVRSLSADERRNLYLRARIGFNMHLSESPRETGNLRMYETPAHGMMLVCDKAGCDAHERIFSGDREAIYYDSIDHAIEKIEYYLAHDDERVEIARAGFERVHSEYEWAPNLSRLLDWSMSLRNRADTDGQFQKNAGA